MFLELIEILSLSSNCSFTWIIHAFHFLYSHLQQCNISLSTFVNTVPFLDYCSFFCYCLSSGTYWVFESLSNMILLSLKNFCPVPEHRLLPRKIYHILLKSHTVILLCVGMCMIFLGLLRVPVHRKCLDWKMDFAVLCFSLSFIFFLLYFSPSALENTLCSSECLTI